MSVDSSPAHRGSLAHRKGAKHGGIGSDDKDKDSQPNSPSPLPKQSLLTTPRTPASSHRRTSSRKGRGWLPLTPQRYIHSINAHSSRLVTSSSFPGNNYVDLANWLLQDASAYSNPSSTHILAVVYDLSTDGNDPQCFTENDLEDFQDFTPHESGAGQLLFIRGFLSPAWLSAIGSKFVLDPEFILRHLDFFAGSVHRHGYSLPSLVSTTSNIIRLCTSTIIHRDEHNSLNDAGKSQCRRDQREDMSTYRRQLRTQAKCGDSIVREFSTIDDHHSIIEQWTGVCVSKFGEGWMGVVWMDQGKDLSVSPTGPWTPHLRARGSAFPVIQHHPKMTVRNTVNVVPANAGKDSPWHLSTIGPEGGLPQSGSLLPMEFKSLLALVDLSRRCTTEPAFGFVPVFVHAAFSEVHLLNLIEGHINDEVDALATNATHGSIENLQFLSNILERHFTHTKDTLRSVGHLFEPHLPSMSPHLTLDNDAGTSGSGTFTVQGLKDDYRDLMIRSRNLMDRCNTGIQTMMNKAMVAESQKAIEQAERVKKLTLLATFFIPLSFVSAVFGMNFKILGQGSLDIWWFFVISAPITVISQIYYIWDSKSVARWLHRRAITEPARGNTA